MIREEGVQRGRARAEVRGWAECVLRALQLRRFEVTDVVRARIGACRDLDTLDRWFDRAYAPEVTRAEDIFTEARVEPAQASPRPALFHNLAFRPDVPASQRTEGRARGVIALLDFRGVQISDTVRERITTCTDPATTDRWFDRAHTVSQAEDLFADA